ncbi:hypothetical protein CAEBREN_04852 [Caenorhabditis brenneri]|uniref:F-box domain-containing protein n=1 Tax=Caenorhabditis brenneri TaxID=135651 RepID=G0PHS3_CAEBE|nr:hypothetical protein CAEBREN_04852 [Caenorhabditis brenneri]
MVGWNDLPVKSKKEVVKRLDFMSRCSMRSTCRADRKIVDSTELYIPRLRVSFLEGFTQATIYTDIGQFLKVVFKEKKDEEIAAYVYRMENEVKITNTTAARRIKGIRASRLFGVFLRHQFIRPNVLIGTLEFEFHPTDHTTQTFCICLLMRSFGVGKVFRAKKLATNCLTKKLTEIYLYNNLIDKTILEGIYNDGVVLSEDSVYPQKYIDTTVFPDPKLDVFKGVEASNPNKIVEIDLEPVQKFVNVPHCESFIYTTEYRVGAPITVKTRAEETEGFVTCRFGETNFLLWEHQHLPVVQLDEHVQMKRIASPELGCVYRWNKSKCGEWMHAMKIENEHKFEEFFKNDVILGAPVFNESKAMKEKPGLFSRINKAMGSWSPFGQAEEVNR